LERIDGPVSSELDCFAFGSHDGGQGQELCRNFFMMTLDISAVLGL
jgi:hypothetical protein